MVRFAANVLLYPVALLALGLVAAPLLVLAILMPLAWMGLSIESMERLLVLLMLGCLYFFAGLLCGRVERSQPFLVGFLGACASNFVIFYLIWPILPLAPANTNSGKDLLFLWGLTGLAGGLGGYLGGKTRNHFQRGWLPALAKIAFGILVLIAVTYAGWVIWVLRFAA
jgi:hypothetical protein